MTEIRSRSVHVAIGAEALRAFLVDLRNLEEMLPQDKVSSFSGSEDAVSFKVQGGLEIRLTRVGTAFEGPRLRLQGGGAPFAFHLDMMVEESGDGATASVVCEADLNPFMKMMAEKPLQSIFQGMAVATEKAFPVD